MMKKIKNPITRKMAIKALVGLSIIGTTMFTTYLFTDNYTLKFRSPVIFQNPVVVNERAVFGHIEDEDVNPFIELEATQSAQVKSFSPSNRLVKHTEQRPGVYAKIKQHFGAESMKYGELISRESGLNPQAINPTSLACGLSQALPCSKMKCDLSDVDCQLDWIDEYVEQRYGNIDQALAFHTANNYY